MSEIEHLGAAVRKHGVDFRVWAPNAERVSVVGSFNDWRSDANPLERDDGGYWFGHVASASAGDEYRYDIDFNGETFSRVDPHARALTDSKGNAVVTDTRFDWDDDDFTPAPLNELVLYELHIGTFNAENGHGTLRSAIDRLPHLRSLGVNGVTLMPITEFVGDTGWGYDMAHLYAVEASYGGPAAFKEFVKAAHREGIAVMLDMVYNHLGFEDNLLWRFDGWHEGKGGGIYFFQDPERGDTPWGPRPDYSRPQVRDYILGNALMWLDEYRLDGLRVDGTFHMRSASKTETGSYTPLPGGWSLLRELTETIRAKFPKKFVIAEDMREDPVVVRSVAEGGAGFHAQWSDRITHAARMPADRKDLPELVKTFREILEAKYSDDSMQRVIFSESHDNAGKDGRIPDAVNPQDPESEESIRRSLLAAAIVFTAPGVPQVFQGQEVLETRYFDIWNPPPLELSWADKFGGVLRFFQDVIALRRNKNGNTAGLTGPHINVFHQNDDAGVLAWHRYKDGGPGDDVIVVANFSSDTLSSYELALPLRGTWRVLLDSGSAEYDPQKSRRTAERNVAAVFPSGEKIEIAPGPRCVVVLGRDD
ncbi:MAG: alpha-amylase family glycosyl hydrolase [Planctomycetota bacterium]|nr:alpha-amylase family glycosyl hydrolase [Planctomycetota bacterium]